MRSGHGSLRPAAFIAMCAAAVRLIGVVVLRAGPFTHQSLPQTAADLLALPAPSRAVWARDMRAVFAR